MTDARKFQDEQDRGHWHVHRSRKKRRSADNGGGSLFSRANRRATGPPAKWAVSLNGFTFDTFHPLASTSVLEFARLFAGGRRIRTLSPTLIRATPSRVTRFRRSARCRRG